MSIKFQRNLFIVLFIIFIGIIVFGLFYYPGKISSLKRQLVIAAESIKIAKDSNDDALKRTGKLEKDNRLLREEVVRLRTEIAGLYDELREYAENLKKRLEEIIRKFTDSEQLLDEIIRDYSEIEKQNDN